MRVLSDLASVNALGKQVPFNCPECGGSLWQIDKGSDLRFRCYTGHAFSAKSFMAEQNKKIDETMWSALRMFEEQKNMLTEMARGKTGSKSALERAKTAQVHIDRIRLILNTNNKVNLDKLPT